MALTQKAAVNVCCKIAQEPSMMDNEYGLCQICNQRVPTTYLMSHIRLCTQSSSRVESARNEIKNLSQQSSRRQTVTDKIVSDGMTSYHTSRKRESTDIDNNNRSRKRGTQIIQYITTINEGVSKIGQQAYTNAIQNEVQGDCCDQSSAVKRKRKHSQNDGSLQGIPWSSYKAISPFLGTLETTETLRNSVERSQETQVNYTNNSRETENSDNVDEFDDGIDFELDEEEQTSTTRTVPRSNVPPVEDEEEKHFNVFQLMKDDPQVRGKLMELKSKTPMEIDLVYSNRERSWLKLAAILEPVNIPKYLYKNIKDWFEEVKHDDDPPLAYKELILKMAKKHGLECIRPFHKYVNLHSGNLVKVTCYDFLSQVFSLLNDPALMRADNVVFGDNPFKRFSRKDYHGDTHTSEWYIMTQLLECLREWDVVIPLIFFIDKTHAKGNGSEPISFTLGIYRRHIRITPEAWRHVGFIPGKMGKLIPLVDYANKDVPLFRARDYHQVVGAILEDLIRVQNSVGIAWRFGDKKANLLFRTMFITGDMEGHAKLTARLGGHNNNKSNHLCDMNRIDSSDPYGECSYVNTDNLWEQQKHTVSEHLSRPELKDMHKHLHKRGYYRVPNNGFTGMKFGANKNGLNSACAICLLHTFKQRFPNDICDIVLGIFGSSEGTVGKLMVEKTMPKLLSRCKRQSDRDYPKLNKFQLRVTGDNKYDASEKYARIFALFLYSVTTCAERIMNEHSKILNNDHRPYINLVGMGLTIYRYLSQEQFPRNMTSGYDELLKEKCIGVEPIQDFLSIFKSLYNNTDANGVDTNDKCCFPKFHYLIHTIDQIALFGSAMNFDGGASESNFKVNTKNPACQSQGRESTFDAQTAANCSDGIILRIALQKSGVRDYKSCNIAQGDGVTNIDNSSDGDSSDSSVTDSIENDEGRNTNMSTRVCGINMCSARFDIDYNTNIVLTSWKDKCVKPRRPFSDDVLQFVRQEMFGDNGVIGTSVPGFTCLNLNGNIYRAHPSYRSGEEWFDHVSVKWEDAPEYDGVARAPAPTTPGERRGYVHPENSYLSPARICMFLDLRHCLFKNDSDLQNQFYMVIVSVATDLETKGPLRDAMNRFTALGSPAIAKFWTMEEGFRLKLVSSIADPVFVLQDFSDNDMLVKTKYVIEIKKYREWATVHNI